MVDQYYRKIEDVKNDIENAIQISSILLKLKGYDDDLSKIDTNENNISSNLGKIGNNENNISSNLGKIGDNENNISTNLSKIGDNENNISSNLEKIGDNENNISSNLSKIGDNINAIKLVNKNSQDNRADISSNLKQIDINKNDISTNLEKIDNFTQYILQSGKDFEEKYTIEKQIFKFNKNKHFYTMFEKEIEFDFTKNSLLFIKNNMYYKYENLSNDYHRLQHEYNIYDGDNLIHKYLFNKDTYYDESLNPILHTNEDFCICFKKNYNKIKINLQLHRHNRHGTGNINLEIDDDNENYINVDYVDRNNEERINTNKNNISSNLGKINTNVTDISSNLGKINNIKNNSSKSHLKNVYNILFYNNNEQISFKDEIFYEKEFDVNANINDFIEIKFKIGLEYRRIDYRNYVKNIYEILDENDNSLYIKSASNSEYSYFSNKVIIDEDIFYTFTKDIIKIKFVIKFQKISSSSIIYLYYMKNDNYRLTIKNYGV